VFVIRAGNFPNCFLLSLSNNLKKCHVLCISLDKHSGGQEQLKPFVFNNKGTCSIETGIKTGYGAHTYNPGQLRQRAEVGVFCFNLLPASQK